MENIDTHGTVDTHDIIEPRVLKGFRDFLPAAEIERALLTEKLTHTFRAFGFVPIDTPALEYSEILLRKSGGETEKQVFRFEDAGKRDVSLRFDLTVPFARFVAEHRDEIYFPFKRYHIAKVWRGEKPQSGRYREFVQCDFDIVGSKTAASDFEILNLIVCSLKALGVPRFTIRINHRGVLGAFLEKINLAEKSESVLRIIDKLAKIGKAETLALLTECCGEKAQQVLDFVSPSVTDFDAVLEHLHKGAGDCEGITRLREIRSMIADSESDSSVFVLDPSITRGLDYYTGIVFETFLDDLPAIGSVCSGGRYDNLTALFYKKEKISGVGSSIGLDRLIAALGELKLLSEKKSFVQALIFCQDEAHCTAYQKAASALRQNGVCAEVFFDAKKMSVQYTYAEKKGICFGVFVKQTFFDDEKADRKITVKNLLTRQEYVDIPLERAVEIILGRKES